MKNAVVATKSRIYANTHSPQLLNKIKQLLRQVSPRVYLDDIDEGLFDYIIPKSSSHTEIKQETFRAILNFSKKNGYLFEFFVAPSGEITFRFVDER